MSLQTSASTNDSSESTSLMTFHSWSLKSNEVTKQPTISYHLIKYTDKSLYIWIGDGECKLENMSCSMQTPYDKDPSTVDLLMINKDDADYVNLSNDLATKLSKRLNKQVVVAFNVNQASLNDDLRNNNSQNSLLFLIEKRIIEEIKLRPEMF